MPTRKSAEAKTSSPSKAGPKPPTIVVGKITQALTDAALHGEEHGFMGDVRDDAAEFVANAVLNRKAGKPSITIETLPPSSGHRTMRLKKKKKSFSSRPNFKAIAFASSSLFSFFIPFAFNPKEILSRTFFHGSSLAS